MAITWQKPKVPRSRLVAAGVFALALTVFAVGPAVHALSAPIRTDLVIESQAAETVEVMPIALSKAQARQLLAKIRRLTRKLRSDSAKLKTATTKVNKINATLR